MASFSPMVRAVAALAVVLAAVVVLFPRQIEYFKEDAAFALDPTAARAFAYGERHFTARDPREYDVDRAEMFFRAAARTDTHIPYLFHELARIAFLRGDLARALTLIDIQVAMHGTETPNSYYVRGLIEGYMGKYDQAEADYQRYLASDPTNWAAINDYTWILLKAGKAQQAADVTGQALTHIFNNPWLLNSNAIAYYDMGEPQKALVAALAAQDAVRSVTVNDWLTAYPGNDPSTAGDGLAALKGSIADNVHRIQLAVASSTIQ